MKRVAIRLSCLSVGAFVVLATLGVHAQAAGDEQAPASAKDAAVAPKDPPKGGQKNQLDKVEVSGQVSEEAKRQALSAAKITVGREELDRYGDATVGDVIKRLPSMAGGGMRGLGGGYTQFLVNGQRPPPGFNVFQLPPSQVERIEILRAPIAEYGARAIAGTVNIVLRQALRQTFNNLNLSLADQHGHEQPTVSWIRNDKLGETGSYNVSVNARRSEILSEAENEITTQITDSDKVSTTFRQSQRLATNNAISINAQLQWRERNGDFLSLQPILVANKGRLSSFDYLSQLSCEANPASQIRCLDYDHVANGNSFNSTFAQLQGQWTHPIDHSTRLELRGSAGSQRSHSSGQATNLKGESAVLRTDVANDDDQRNWSLTSKLSHKLQNEHSLVFGAEAEGQHFDQTFVVLQNSRPLPALADFSGKLSALTMRYAYYAQDEWSAGKQWGFYAGLRGETITTRGENTLTPITNRASVWTPLLHAVWKYSEDSRDQIRASLTRSYRSPNLRDMIAQPIVDLQYPCPEVGLCGANFINNPDQAGNPGLRPELARGLEIGYELYPTKGGFIGANFFYRGIQNVIRRSVEQEDVVWASVPRWVSRPRNIGSAKTYGLELEAKFRLDQYIKGALPINFRSNLSIFRSRVSQLPRPYNTLDQQPRGVVNVGFDYRLRDIPLTYGSSINYTPAMQVRQSLTQINSLDRKIGTSAFALWTFNPAIGLRVSLNYPGRGDYVSGSTIAAPDATIYNRTATRQDTVWTARLELKI